MSRPKKRSLLHKFLLFVLPFLILAIIITGVVLSWTSYTYFQKTIGENYANILKSSAGEIRLYMQQAQRDLEALALVISATKLDEWGKDMALTAFNHEATEFVSVSLISRQGEKIASTGWENLDVSHGPMFKKALEGQTAISGVMVTKQDIPYVHIAVPVSHLGEAVEVLWGELNLKSVWDVLEGITIGETGQVHIMDLTGRYLAHRQIDRVVSSHPAEKPDIIKELRESDAPVGWIKREDGTRLYCLGAHIPDLDWVIVLSQACPEIYAYLYRNIHWAVFITCFLSLLAVLLGWYRVKRFLRPIHKLHAQVQRIGQGDLDQKVSIDSQDEIGDLALAFNEMTDSLKKYIQREVETAKELVHAKNLAVLGSTSSKVTHEVGNLLNNAGIVLSTLKGEALSPTGKKSLEILEKESARVREFIHNFLQFAKKPELRLSKTSLHAIIREVLFVHQPDAEKRGIRLDLNWPSDVPPVNVDARLMYQVLNNLVKNSLEAMTDSGKIRIDGKIEGEHLLITMEDTGPGIEPDALERIFDPFFTTKGKKGTGLGLSIAKSIVEAHRGAIECQSQLGKGTAFILRLPLQ
ncbi:MAG: sensor histidine kinase [Deltaproteobacteria bacterium]|nr:sensor histidine kinase [Deltaproteobacteria bacterium]MBW1793671.1 sensor histidine kinase [Deltaproteobacteria bacterium]MBW2329796.1 sensor histidine kinase [Deltaproteobacteria bacterium]